MADIRDIRKAWSGIALALVLGLGVSLGAAGAGWPEYGGDAGGRRYSMTLYFSTAIVHAIDAVTGRPLWRHDAVLDRRLRYSEVASRGVTYWRNPGVNRGPCAELVFLGTIDGRLIALDATDGKPCVGFGARGSVDLTRGVRLRSCPEYGVTAPPVVIGDNRATNLELGVVRAFDALTGALRWHSDPIPRDAMVPRDAANPLFTEIDEQAAQWTGAANAWAPLSVDRERGLVFVPTGSASPDFYGSQRPGDNRWANSIVALRAATGELAWGQQLVRHDLWEYVPASRVPGENAASMQPVTSLPPLVSHSAVTPDDAWGLTFWDRGLCRERISRLRSEGICTPPSLQGSILRPAYTGGPNWGGLAFDPERQFVIAPVMDLAAVVTLADRERLAGMARSGEFDGSEFAQMLGTPSGMRRELLLSPLGVPCSAPRAGTPVRARRWATRWSRSRCHRDE